MAGLLDDITVERGLLADPPPPRRGTPGHVRGLLADDAAPEVEETHGPTWSDLGRWAYRNPLDATALALSPTGVPGGIAGTISDLHRYLTDPSSRTWGNYAFTALGFAPFGAATKVVKGGRAADSARVLLADEVAKFASGTTHPASEMTPFADVARMLQRVEEPIPPNVRFTMGMVDPNLLGRIGTVVPPGVVSDFKAVDPTLHAYSDVLSSNLGKRNRDAWGLWDRFQDLALTPERVLYNRSQPHRPLLGTPTPGRPDKMDYVVLEADRPNGRIFIPSLHDGPTRK
jgi:hypothetical protein